MDDNTFQTTDQDKAEVLWLVAESSPRLNRVGSDLLFQFPKSDKLLCVEAKYDAGLPMLLCPRKLRQIGRILDARITRFLTDSEGVERNG